MSDVNTGSDARARRQRWIVLLLVVALTLLGNLARDLVQPDEGRYAEIPREMLSGGDWIVPHLNGLPYVEKPPLQYWATAAAYAAFGVSAWVSRLWNLLLGIAGVVVVYLTGRRLWNARAGEFAALILMSMPLYALVGQLNLLDMGITFFLTGALCTFLLAQREAAGSAESRRLMLLCWLSVGFGFLQKGLVALAIPFIALLVYSLWRRDSRVWLRLRLVEGALIVGVLSLPWLVALWLRDTQFAWFFLIHEHFTRFMTNEHHREEAWWFFIAVFAAGALPWTLQLVRDLLDPLRSRAAGHFDPEAALAVWALVVLIFFSLSGSKLAPYIMPCLPPLALLSGRSLDQGLGQGRGVLMLAGAGALALAGILAHPLAVALMRDGPNKPYYLAVSHWALGGGLIAAAGVLLAGWQWRRGQLRAAVAAVGLALFLAWMTFLGGANTMAVVRGTPGAAALVQPRLPAGAPFYCVGAYLQSLTFDLARPCTLVEYTGELQLQFDPDGRHQPLDFEAFAARWRAEPTGMALTHRDQLRRMAASGLQLRTVAEYPDFLIVEHP
jgi:4-amino-4-deoxy-L-arabinose transferase-like glycosyltransferase